MGNTARVILWGAIILAFVSFGIVSIFFARYPLPQELEAKLKVLKFFIGIYKMIGIGFLAAALGSLIPQALREAQSRFERLKESRVAYSEAQTGARYLPSKIAYLQYSDAIKLVEDTHLKKHVAETYSELSKHIRSPETPEEWGKKLSATFDAIQSTHHQNIAKWNDLEPKKD